MPGQLAILNPRSKAPRRRKRKVKTTMARRRRKMTAKQRKYFGKRRRGKSAAKVVVVSSNPRRRRRRSRKIFNINPRRRRHLRRFRRNPIERGAGIVSNSLMPGVIGAAGAIGSDWLLGNFGGIVPFQFRTPTMWPFVRVAAALGVGALVSALGNEEAGAEAAAGAIAVALYPLGRSMFAGALPGSGLGRYLKGMGAHPAAAAHGAALAQRRRLARLGFARQRRLQGLGATSPNAMTKFRILRDGQTNGRLGYVGPARTLGRYLSR